MKPSDNDQREQETEACSHPAEPTCDFWAVLQANSTRKAAQRQRFPKSADSTPHSTRQKELRSPEPWQNRRPFPAKPPRSRRTRTRAKSQQPSARQRERNPQPCEQGSGENSHPVAITVNTPPLAQPLSLHRYALHPFAEVLEGQRQHRGVAQARNGHDERFEQISEERILAVDAANAPDDAAVFPTCPA